MLRPVDSVRSYSYQSPTRPAEAGPTDRYEPSEAPEPDLRAAARLLDSKLRLDKPGSDYRLSSWCSAPDGTVFSGYTEADGQRGYVACAAPDGAVRWELALAEGKVQRVGLLPDGNLLVGTDTAVTTLAPDGRLVGRQKGAVAGVWSDGQGGTYWLDAKDRRLHGSGLAAEVLEVRPTGDGGLLARTAEAVHRLGPGGLTQSSTAVPSFAPVRDTKHEVAGSWALEGGEVLLHKQSTTTTWPPFHHGMEHDPMFGGQMLRTPDITVRNTMVRTSSSGEALWESPDMGEKAKPVVLRDGSTFFARDRGVERVAPTGAAEVAFTLKGTVSDLLPGEGDTLLVRSGDTVTRRAPSGEVLATVTARPGMQLRGDAPGGLLVFADAEGAELWTCDPATGAWARRTDPDVDHSVALTVENLKSQEAPPPVVREEDEWIAIGGIRLERRS